jgi:hypothetical protein
MHEQLLIISCFLSFLVGFYFILRYCALRYIKKDNALLLAMKIHRYILFGLIISLGTLILMGWSVWCLLNEYTLLNPMVVWVCSYVIAIACLLFIEHMVKKTRYEKFLPRVHDKYPQSERFTRRSTCPLCWVLCVYRENT